MNLVLRARVERGTLVPVQPVPLPEGEVVEIEIRMPNEPLTGDSWDALWKQFLARARSGLHIPDEALEREHLYNDGR